MKIIISLFLLVLITSSVFAQSFDLKYNFEKGKTYLYREVTTNDLTQEMMGQEMKVNSISTTLTRLVADENTSGSLTVIVSFDSIVAQTKTPQMDTTMVIEDMIGKRMKIMMTNKGKITEKEMIDSINLEGQMVQLVQKEAMQFTELPENSIKIGDTWNVTKTDSMNMMGGMTILTSEIQYSLASTEKMMGYEVVKIPFTAKVKIEGKGSIMGFEFFLDGGGNSKGDFYFSPKEGIPVMMEVTQNFDVTMAATGDQNMIIPINQNVKTTRTLVK
jgi:hypothetical protein